MIESDARARPDAVEAHRQWLAIRPTLSPLKLRWRLRPRSEPRLETAFYDTYALFGAALFFRSYIVATCTLAVFFYGAILR